MIDCSRTENYFAEKKRMIKEHRYICKLKDCADCPLHLTKNGMSISCTKLEKNYHGKAIAIMQKWSNEHPQKTYLSEFLKNYPNAPLSVDGTPKLCPEKLGLTNKKPCCDCISGDCVNCWNQPVEESESK